MRGTRWWGAKYPPPVRFIPAHAGNTEPPEKVLHGVTVHPRACGEHWPEFPIGNPTLGSSPRMRGTPCKILLCWWMGRFIPAHAGNTPCGPGSHRFPAVHPRACGEHTGEMRQNVPSPGSSPRMRGTLAKLLPQQIVDRFIPAHAGNTDHVRGEWRVLSVHPRACGEHMPLTVRWVTTDGSSPRMRGTRMDRVLP